MDNEKILHGKQKIIVIGPLVVWDESKTKHVNRMGCKCVLQIINGPVD
jgi:hypothetical protein